MEKIETQKPNTEVPRAVATIRKHYQNALQKSQAKKQITNDSLFTSDFRATVLEALSAVEGAKQKCIAVGQRLNEIKAQCEHGEFLERLQNTVPEISADTANLWMRAARNVCQALPPLTIEIEATVSQVLATPDAELPPQAREYKQAWLDFTEGKTIKDCLNAVTVYGEDASRIDRAVNGKTKGGVGMQRDRKKFEAFTATKLQHITHFLCLQKIVPGTVRRKVVGWRKLSPVQQTQIGAAFTAFLETAPPWLLVILADKIKTEIKLGDAERLAR